MLRKTFLYCGLVAPILYVITAIVGATLRNDYSHIANAISELISNGAPNKAVLATLPFVRAGLIKFELIPLKAYPGFNRLFANFEASQRNSELNHSRDQSNLYARE